MIEEGANLHQNLQMALSNKELLINCLGPVLTEKLDREGTSALHDADAVIHKLKQQLQVSILFARCLLSFIILDVLLSDGLCYIFSLHSISQDYAYKKEKETQNIQVNFY